MVEQLLTSLKLLMIACTLSPKTSSSYPLFLVPIPASSAFQFISTCVNDVEPLLPRT